MEKEKALSLLLHMTGTSLGFRPSTPSEFNQLSILIKKKLGRSLSQSSIKRLFGYVRYDGFPTTSTLNILSQFNGYRDWMTFLNSDISDRNPDDSGYLEGTLIQPHTLTAGDRLMLRWGRDKSLEIEAVAPERFLVIATRNIKLEPSDLITLKTICIGLPLYATDITRGKDTIPAYVGARKGGLTSARLIPRNPDSRPSSPTPSRLSL